MAGNFPAIRVRDETRVSTAIRGQWEVQYSRFFSYPSPTASKCPDLVPLPRYLRDRGSLGTWLSASSPALLRLAVKPSAAGTVLDLTLGGALLEEHYVSKLHFSWPQVKCISGFPARGARAVFVSFLDVNCERQKFAVRFSLPTEVEAFVKILKEIFVSESDVKPFSCNHGSTQTDFMSQRDSELLRIMNPAKDYSPEQPSFPQKTVPVTKFERDFPALPPSFTSLLTDYCPVSEKTSGFPDAPEEVVLKSQIAKYMEDASFHDMLVKVERVINDMGGGEYSM